MDDTITPNSTIPWPYCQTLNCGCWLEPLRFLGFDIFFQVLKQRKGWHCCGVREQGVRSGAAWILTSASNSGQKDRLNLQNSQSGSYCCPQQTILNLFFFFFFLTKHTRHTFHKILKIKTYFILVILSKGVWNALILKCYTSGYKIEEINDSLL